MSKPLCNKELHKHHRACDGDILHPGHAQYHLFRLIVGSILGGCTLVLVFFFLGFLGNIRFIWTMDLAFDWLIYGGSALGIVLGLLFSIVAAFCIRILPVLKRTTHPLAIVRSGFMLLIVWALIAFSWWPASIWGFIVAPMVAFLVALLSIRVNPWAELVPHSASGRVLGTAIGPLIVMASILMILIPMLQKGFGGSYSPKLIVVAADGVDAPALQGFLNTDQKENYPNLSIMKETGGFGSINSTAPLVPDRAWADMMTGQGEANHNILDSHRTSEDLSVYAIWDILSMRDYSVGLFQILPPHEINNDLSFDIPAPGTFEGSSALNTSALDTVRNLGRRPGLPGIEESVLTACYLARYGVTLETITDILKQYVIEKITQPSPRLIYLNRKLLEFRVESDLAISQIMHNHVDAAFLRVTSLEEIFLTYWRFSNSQDFGPLPANIDSATATGLAKAIPEAYSELDRFIGRLNPFVGDETLLAVVSAFPAKRFRIRK
ncbi:MAG: hypothetical protein NTY09_11265 [bacterium]|nr:hypothetical protein [bacterium]